MNVCSQRRRYGFSQIGSISARRMLAAAIASSAMLGGPALAQALVDVYGLLDLGMTYNNRVATTGTATRSRVSIDPGNLQGSRLGFRAAEKLDNGLTALFVLENGFTLDTGAAAQGGLLFGRTAVVGLAGAFGRVTLGRQTDFLYSDLAFYDSVIPMGNLVYNVRALNLDRSEGSRVNNSIRYNTPSPGGLSASVIYGFGEQAGNRSAGRSFGLGAKYEQGPFRIGAGYFQSAAAAAGGAPIVTPSSDAGTACVNVNGAPGDVCLKTFMVASTWQLGQARLYGSWSEVKLPLTVAGGARRLGGTSNDKIDVYDLGMVYNFTPPLALLASAVQSRARFRGSASDGRVNQLNVGLDYFMSKRTDIYTWAGRQRTSDMLSPGIYGAPGADLPQTVFQVGMRHTF